jgi:prepilin-type N-terminal cleavage/methylation domain-containing protein
MHGGIFMSKRKLQRGVTLVELLIAVTVLAVSVAGIFTAFGVGFMTSSRAHDMTISSIEAQLQMELLMGRSWDGDLVNGPSLPGDPIVAWGQNFLSNGLHVRIVYRPDDMGTARRGHNAWNMTLPPNTGNTPPVPAPPAGVSTACNHSAGACGQCPIEDLILIQATVYVYLNEADAIAGNANWAIRQNNIINVNGRIM